MKEYSLNITVPDNFTQKEILVGLQDAAEQALLAWKCGQLPDLRVDDMIELALDRVGCAGFINRSE